MEHLEYTLVMSARAHAKKVASGPAERRAAAIYYLRVTATEFRRKLYYDLALAADRVRRRIELAGSVQAVVDEMAPKKPNLIPVSEKTEPPASNTGATPYYQQSLEEYI